MFYLRGKCIHSNFSVHLPSALIIIGWIFIHEFNISPPLSLARFFLTQQLIYKSKIRRHNVSLDIFVLGTNIARNLHLPGLEKKHFSYIRTHAFFCIRFRSLYCSKSKNIWGSGPYHRGKKISALIGDWENIIAYGKNPSKARQVRFIPNCK